MSRDKIMAIATICAILNIVVLAFVIYISKTDYMTDGSIMLWQADSGEISLCVKQKGSWRCCGVCTPNFTRLDNE